MKLTISLAGLLALIAIIPKEVPTAFEEQVNIVHAGSREKRPTPYITYVPAQACTRELSYIRPMSSEVSPDGVPSPVHCTSCGLGVYAPTPEGSVRCSYCKHTQD